MQAVTVCFSGPLPLKPTKNLAPRRSSRRMRTLISPKAVVTAASDTNTVEYSSAASVFPVEACETIGGIACNVLMFPEVKLGGAQASDTRPRVSSEEIERDYLDYNEAKTVFPSEACEDLGGEFCDPEYQKGVY